ncbi:MAG: hypothetical protein IPG93_03655 [Burkholderiales bacterium]|nr:hypothetical protein [Burkholderiales bacterium]
MTTLHQRIALTLLISSVLPALPARAADVATALAASAPGTSAAAASAPGRAASAPKFHVPAPRPGPGGSTVGAKHGGLVLSDQGVAVEFDAQPTYLDLYLTADDKPVDLTGATAHITLLNGVDIVDAYLDPSADKQRLTIDGEYKIRHGTRMIVRVALADGRKLNLRYLIIMLPRKAAPTTAAPAASSAAASAPRT